jgi:hypothetical protein
MIRFWPVAELRGITAERLLIYDLRRLEIRSEQKIQLYPS